MKKVIATLLAGAIGVSMMAPAFAAEADDSIKIYVSLSGDNEADGLSLENAVQTPKQAQTLAREYKQAGKTTEIIFDEGTYYLDEALKLTSEDSGEEDAPVIYRAYQGKEVSFTRAMNVLDTGATWQVLGNEGTDALIPSGIKTGVFKISLEGFSKLHANGREEAIVGGFHEMVFLDGEMLNIAQTEENIAFEQVGKETAGDENDSENLFYMPDEIKNTWKGAKEAYALAWDGGYGWDLSSTGEFGVDGLRKVVDADGNLVYNDDGTVKTETVSDTVNLGQMGKNTYKILNIPHELDTPGEYFIDRNTKTLYFYPGNPAVDLGNVTVATNAAPPPNQAYMSLGYTELIFSRLEQWRFYNEAKDKEGHNAAVVSMKGTENVKFEGIDIINAGSRGFCIDNGNNITIYNSIMNGLGNYAVDATSTTNLLVTDCTMTNLRRGAVNISGGSQLSLTSANNVLKNSTITNFSTLYKTTVGVTLAGVGSTVENCEISNAPFHAINFSGNDHIIRNNRIYNVVSEVMDAGAIYAMRGYIARGTLIENNFIYNTNVDYTETTWGTSSTWGRKDNGVNNQGIYIDDLQSGITVKNNVIYNMNQGMLFGGGRDNIVEGNAVIECAKGMRYDQRGKTGSSAPWHMNPTNTQSSSVYLEVNNFLAQYDADSELKAKWDAAYGENFTDMIADFRILKAEYDNAVADGTASTIDWNARVKALGTAAPENISIKNNLYAGYWATQYPTNHTWYMCYDVPGGASAETGATFASIADAGVTITKDADISKYNITVGEKDTAVMGKTTSSYVPSYDENEVGTSTNSNFKIVAAVYDDAGALKTVETKDGAYIVENQDYSIDIDVPEGATDAWKVKLMIWDSVSGLRPMADTPSIFGGQAAN